MCARFLNAARRRDHVVIIRSIYVAFSALSIAHAIVVLSSASMASWR
jgi:hypothetical protein